MILLGYIRESPVILEWDRYACYYQVIIDYSKEESQEISSPSSIVKAYEADDPPTMDSANPEAPSIKTPEFKFPEMKSIDQTPEIYEKPRSKESKGFRKLLKFGKKSHTSALGDDALDSDALSVDDLTAAAVSASDGMSVSYRLVHLCL